MIAGGHADFQQVPALRDGDVGAGFDGDGNFGPFRAVHLKHLHDAFETDVVHRGADERHDFLGSDDGLVLGGFEIYARDEVGQRMNLIRGAELILEAGLGGDEMHRVGRVGLDRHGDGEDLRRERGETEDVGLASLDDAQLAVGHGLIDVEIQIDLGAFENFQVAGFLGDARGRLGGVFGKAKFFLELQHMRTRLGLDGEQARDAVAGADAVLQRGGADGERGGELSAALRTHLDALDFSAERLGFEEGLLGIGTGDADDDGQFVAEGREQFRGVGFNDLDFGAGDALEIGQRCEGAGEELPAIAPAREQAAAEHDRGGGAQPDADEARREEALHVQVAELLGDAGLHEGTERRGIPACAGGGVGVAQFDGGEQLFAQFGPGLLDPPRELADVRRAKQRLETKEPGDRQRAGINARGQRPADGFGQDEKPVHRGREQQRAEEGDDRATRAAQQHQRPPAAAKGGEFFANERVESIGHRVGCLVLVIFTGGPDGLTAAEATSDGGWHQGVSPARLDPNCEAGEHTRSRGGAPAPGCGRMRPRIRLRSAHWFVKLRALSCHAGFSARARKTAPGGGCAPPS